MTTLILQHALKATAHPAVVSLESHKLVTSMETALQEEHQAEAMADLLQGIGEMDDTAEATELLGHVATMHGVEQDAVSLESLGGLIATVRSLFGSGKKKKEEEPNKEPKHYKALMEFLNKYYLNSAWLAKQQFVDGVVSGQDLAEALTRNNKFAPETLVTDLTKYASEFKAFFTKYMDAVVKHSDQIEAIDEKLIAQIKSLDTNAADYEAKVVGLVRTAVKQMKAVQDPVKLAGSKFKLLGNRQTEIKQWRYSGDPGANCDGAITTEIKPPASVESVPAIQLAMVKPLVDAIVSLYETVKMVEERTPQWCDHSDGEHRFMQIVERKDELLWSQYGTEMYWQGQARRLVWDLGLNKITPPAVIAVLKWIDRSIKTQ